MTKEIKAPTVAEFFTQLGQMLPKKKETDFQADVKEIEDLFEEAGILDDFKDKEDS